MTKINKLNFVSGILILFLSLFLIQCGINVFPLSQDTQLGSEMDKEIRRNPQQYPILNNNYVQNYVQNLVNKILISPKIKYKKNFPYKVTIINDDKVLNAFCTPGGYIYVYTGILKYLEDEASLAGVVGHEIAHAENRHGTQHMTNSLGLEVLASLALGNNPSELTKVAANAGALIAMLKNSREDETEADNSSFEYLRSSNYWPGGIKKFFEKMLAEKGNRSTGGKLDEWMSTHPLPQSRVDNVNNLLRKNNIPSPGPQNLMATEYRDMLKQLNNR